MQDALSQMKNVCYVAKVLLNNIPEPVISQVRMQDPLSQVKNICYVTKVHLNNIPETY